MIIFKSKEVLNKNVFFIRQLSKLLQKRTFIDETILYNNLFKYFIQVNEIY